MTENVKRPPVVTASASGLGSFKQNDRPDTTKKQAAQSWRDVLKIHPAADLFRSFEGKELDDLVTDIRDNGLVRPITLDKDGALIDGRNRLNACEIAGVEPRFETYEGDDPVAYIIACNIRRRHLRKQEQADLIVAALAMRTNLAAAARSATRGESGQLAGSTKNPLKSAVVEECAKHDIGKRTAEGALAKFKGPQQPRRKPATKQSTKPAKPASAINSLVWADIPKPEREKFMNAIGFESWWHDAPQRFRDLAESMTVGRAPPDRRRLSDAANDDPMAIPTALKRTPTDRFGRPRPEPGSLLKRTKEKTR